GTGSLTLQYDSISGGFYKNAQTVALANKNTWKQFTFNITDAYFGNRQNGGADFRIAGNVGMTFFIDAIEVAAAPLPARIGLSPVAFDRSVVLGSNLPNDSFSVTNVGDIPLNYSISSNAPWVSVSPASGWSMGEADPIDVIYSTSGLPMGTAS